MAAVKASRFQNRPIRRKIKMTNLPPPETTLGIIAASGTMPRVAADVAAAGGRSIFIITLDGISDGDFSGYPSRPHDIGAMAAIIDDLKSAGCADVILAGQLLRPKLQSLKPDAMAIRIIGRIMAMGDDGVLTALREEFAANGLTIIDIADLLPHDYADFGVMVGGAPNAEIDTELDDDVQAAIDLGAAYLAAAGAFDVGQSCVVQGQRIIAVEAAEGTDAMLERAAAVCDPDIAPLVMVKMLKSGQDRALDPPAIGVVTVEKSAAAGIGHIAIESGGVIIADRDATFAAAARLGLCLVGIKA